MGVTYKIKNSELYIIGILFLSLTALLYGYYVVMSPYTYGDTAFLIETIASLSSGGAAMSHLLSQNAAEIELARAALDIYCQTGMLASQFASDPYDVFSLHAYLILYFIAPIARIFGALQAISAFTAVAFTLVPSIAYMYLRKSGASVWSALAVVAVCVLHPAWQISSGGQFYVDRLFLPLSMLYVLLIHSYLNFEKSVFTNDKWLLASLVIIGLLAGFTSERNMLTLAIFSGVYAVTSAATGRKRSLVAIMAVIFLAYVITYTLVFSENPDTERARGSILNLSQLIAAASRPGIGEYLWFNGLLLIFPMFLVPRLFLAILPIVAINCFITVGGAEKNGWGTHYHSHYFGILLAAFVIAVSNLNSISKVHTVIRVTMAPAITILALLMPFPVSFYKDQGIFLALWDFYVRPLGMSSALAQKAVFDELAERVPAGVDVTATEWGATAWFLRGNTSNIFPLGVGTNAYMMIQALGDMPSMELLSAVRYRPDKEAADQCFVSVIAEKYDFVARSGTWVLFKLKSHDEAQ